MSKCMIVLYKGGTDRINTVVELSAEHNRDVAVNEVLAENGIDGKVKPSSWSKQGIVETAYIGRNRIEVTPYKAYSEVRELVYGKEEMITISEYAEMHGITAATMRQRIARGCHPEAVKMGRDWLIRSDAPFTDGRYKEDKKMRSKQELIAMARELWGAGWDELEDKEKNIRLLMSDDEDLSEMEAEVVYNEMLLQQELSESK